MAESRPAFALEVRNLGTDSPRRARHWLCIVLEHAELPQDQVDTACLVVSELVTNAVTHSDSARIVVSAALVAEGLRLVVHDDGTGADWQPPAGLDLDERGRGLVLVRALAEVGIHRHAHGCTITALIPAGTEQ